MVFFTPKRNVREIENKQLSKIDGQDEKREDEDAVKWKTQREKDSKIERKRNRKRKGPKNVTMSEPPGTGAGWRTAQR